MASLSTVFKKLLTVTIEGDLRNSRAALRARKTPASSAYDVADDEADDDGDVISIPLSRITRA